MALKSKEVNLDAKLKILICKKETLFARVNNVYALSNNISAYDSRSNEQFLILSEVIDECREKFELIIDEINEINLQMKPDMIPSYADLECFEDMYLRVKRIRNKILSSDSSAALKSNTQISNNCKNNYIKLPPIELPSFDGKTENWPIFYESFKTNIHENAQLSDSQRVQYLVGKLTQSAQKFLAGVVPTGDTYSVIWDSLVTKYQDKRALGTYYLNNIFDLKNCQNSAVSLDSFIEKYSASILALKHLDISDLTDFILLHCALKKIDVQIVQAFELSVGKKDIPSYRDLISFIKNHVKILERSIVNDSSSLSNPRMKQNLNKQKSLDIRAHAFVARNNNDTGSSMSPGTCILCDKTNHTLCECFQFKRMKSPMARFDFIKSKHGCVNCLSSSHSVSKCPVPASCKICKDKMHNTLLHFEKNKCVTQSPPKSPIRTVTSPNNNKQLSMVNTRPCTAACVTLPAVSGACGGACVSTVSLAAVPPALQPSVSRQIGGLPISSGIRDETARRIQSCDCSIRGAAQGNAGNTGIPSKEPSPLSLSTSYKSSVSTILLATVQVYAKAFHNNNRRLVRCLIDNGSQNHLITLECCQKLDLYVVPLTNSVIRGVGMSSRPIHGYVDFEIVSRVSPYNKYNLHALVVDCITDQLPSHLIDTCDMNYLRDIDMADLSWNIPGVIDVVLGAQLFSHIYLGHKIESGSSAPPALLTSFGYVLMGDCPCSSSFSATEHELSFSAVALNELDYTLQRFWELEEIPAKKFLSPEETECENVFVASVSRDDEGRYSVALPFCVSPRNLGNSRGTAHRRFLYLERKLRKVSELREKYNTVIKEYIDKGYLSEVAACDINDDGYYIPHHAVIRMDKPMPRIVLDASARTHSGLSLNDILHCGPNLQADLFLLLLNFRLFPVAITADVQQMYLQVGIPFNDRKYLRILFRFNDEEGIRTFQFNRLPFGLKCSPFLAMRTLRQLAADMAADYPDAANVTESKFYMDDLVHSVSDEPAAVLLAKNLISLFNAGCMNLIKWSSNSSILLNSLPDSHRNSINFDDDNSSCPNSKVLGLSWNPIEDLFFLRTTVAQEKCTKRNILSIVARLFDVLGFVAPITFYAKALIKELWLAKIGWDDCPSEDIISRFSRLMQEFPLLSTLRIPRHVNVTSSSEVVLVGFCDASLVGYGCVLYVHTTDASGNISVRFLCAKSKVSPTKITTLARLELCAAVLLSKLMRLVLDTYSGRIRIAGVYAFSDSTIALSWICSTPHRWSIFVSNRVSQCHEHLASDNFYHVKGIDNPSDCVSRGMLPSQLILHSLYWNGPDWLLLPPCEWPVHKFVPSNIGELPEHKSNVMTATVIIESSVLYSLSQRISSWSKLLRITVYILRFIKKIESSCNNINSLYLAEKFIVKIIQQHHFVNDLRLIKSKNLPSKKLRYLSVFMDSEGVLRIGGRLARADLPFEAKHPALLPKHDHVVNIIITHFHELYCHAGPGLLMSILRQKFWILDARTIIRGRVQKCNACFRVNPSHPTPKMADLPSYRITEAKAFVHTGVDYAGPLRILLTRRRGQHAQKAYICLFVCLVTKAVHIELVTELSSDCFLSAFKRFISRRGPVSFMYSDNGTNFVGARAQLDEIYRLLLDSQHNNLIKRELEQHRIEWKMIPPRAPHFGALWESNIKSLKTHLYRVIGNQLLTYEELQTVLVQIESIMNSRPLSVISADPHPEVLTPAHFLMSTPLKHLPAADFTDNQINLVGRKKLLDCIVASYWKRWRAEYLHTLQLRQKWHKSDQTIQLGTVVLLGQDDVAPFAWPVGVITEVFPGVDGIVRVATVKTSHGAFKRPIVKLYPLPNQ